MSESREIKRLREKAQHMEHRHLPQLEAAPLLGSNPLAEQVQTILVHGNAFLAGALCEKFVQRLRQDMIGQLLRLTQYTLVSMVRVLAQ